MSISYLYESLKPLKQKGQDEYEPDEEQIWEYAKYIGVELPGQQYLLQLAKEGVKALLPKNWEACQAADGELVYRNTITKIVQQQHPLDNFYKQKVIQLREEYKNYVQSEEEQKISDLNTIFQQKSEDRSLSGGSQSKTLTFIQKVQTDIAANQQNSSELNKAMMFENSKQLGVSQIQSKILPHISSFAFHNKNYQIKKSDKKLNIKLKKNNQVQKWKEKLQMLKQQQKLAQQLLSELKKGNNTMIQKIKQRRKQKNGLQSF